MNVTPIITMTLLLLGCATPTAIPQLCPVQPPCTPCPTSSPMPSRTPNLDRRALYDDLKRELGELNAKIKALSDTADDVREPIH